MTAGAAQGWIVERMIAALAARVGGEPAFVLEVIGRPPRRFGDGAPQFTLRLRTLRAVRAAILLDEAAIGEAYLDGEIDIEGSFLAAFRLRSGLGDFRLLSRLWSTYAEPLLFGQARQDEASIREHYDEDAELYLSFLDPRWRCYSHGYFAADDEPLEDAVERKLGTALAAVGAKPGERVLDVGAGWGAFTHFAGERGVRVTSLTLSAPAGRRTSSGPAPRWCGAPATDNTGASTSTCGAVRTPSRYATWERSASSWSAPPTVTCGSSSRGRGPGSRSRRCAGDFVEPLDGVEEPQPRAPCRTGSIRA